jgi:hypothetical protein
MSSRRRLKSTSAEPEKHFVNMAEWLAMESAAEIKRMEERRRIQNTGDAEKSGETILDVVVTDDVRGLGGHQLVTFKRRNETLADALAPTSRWSTGGGFAIPARWKIRDRRCQSQAKRLNPNCP